MRAGRDGGPVPGQRTSTGTGGGKIGTVTERERGEKVWRVELTYKRLRVALDNRLQQEEEAALTPQLQTDYT